MEIHPSKYISNYYIKRVAKEVMIWALNDVKYYKIFKTVYPLFSWRFVPYEIWNQKVKLQDTTHPRDYFQLFKVKKHMKCFKPKYMFSNNIYVFPSFIYCSFPCTAISRTSGCFLLLAFPLRWGIRRFRSQGLAAFRLPTNRCLHNAI